MHVYVPVEASCAKMAIVSSTVPAKSGLVYII